MSNKPATNNAMPATIILVITAIVSVLLRACEHIGDLTLVTLLTIGFVVFLAVFFGDRLLIVSLKELRIEFSKVEAARAEVERREEEVKKIALTVSDMILFASSLAHRFGSEESHKLEKEWIVEKVGKVLDATKATPSEREQVFRFMNAVKKMDEVRESNPAESEAMWDAIWESVRREISTAKAD